MWRGDIHFRLEGQVFLVEHVTSEHLLRVPISGQFLLQRFHQRCRVLWHPLVHGLVHLNKVWVVLVVGVLTGIVYDSTLRELPGIGLSLKECVLRLEHAPVVAAIVVADTVFRINPASCQISVLVFLSLLLCVLIGFPQSPDL